MREIEFRGKRVDNGEWVYGYYYVSSDGIHRIYNYFNGGNYQIIPDTLSQYTGLKDNKGNKIFEGNIIKHIRNNSIGEVIFEDGQFYSTNCCKECFSTFRTDFEVIGNVYENLELLEKK